MYRDFYITELGREYAREDLSCNFISARSATILPECLKNWLQDTGFDSLNDFIMLHSSPRY